MIYKTYFIVFWKKGCYVAASCISNSQVTKFNFQVCHRLNKNSFKSGQIYIKDAPCAKTNAKSIFRFLFFDLWSILYPKFNENWPILITKMTISKKLKIGKFIYHSFQQIPHLSCKYNNLKKNVIKVFLPFG